MIVNIWGGLGNQMFLYAFAKSLEVKGYSPKLDVRSYNIIRHHKYTDHHNQTYLSIRKLELVDFSLSLPLLNYTNKANLEYEEKLSASIFIEKIKKRCFDLIVKPNLITDSNISSKKITDRSYFKGYFADIKYFNHIYDQIQKDFTLRNPLSPENNTLRQLILKTPNSCFIHVRLGDYLDPRHWMFVKLGKAYYENAIKLIKSKIKKPHFFIFSNDIQWCEQNFLQSLDSEITKNTRFTFVKNNHERNATEEMELMRSCSHAIIANSTFSWWAAYLINKDNKIIILPTHFQYYQKITNSLIPPPRNQKYGMP